MMERYGAKDLLRSIEDLKRGKVGRLVETRLCEFGEMGGESSREIFKELSFCMLCANYAAERSIEIQKALGDDFLNLSEAELRARLVDLGYRFPNVRAKYIAEARR